MKSCYMWSFQWGVLLETQLTKINKIIIYDLIAIPDENCITFFDRSSNILVIDLGQLRITSDPDQERIVSTKVC